MENTNFKDWYKKKFDPSGCVYPSAPLDIGFTEMCDRVDEYLMDYANQKQPTPTDEEIGAESIQQAIKDIEFFSKTHIEWAEYFEQNPNVEKKYVETKEWDSASTHRDIVSKYDNVLRILKEVNLNKSQPTEQQNWISVEDDLPDDLRTVWLANLEKNWIWLGCRAVFDSENNWTWASSDGVVYIDNEKIVAECESDDLDVTHWMPLPEFKTPSK